MGGVHVINRLITKAGLKDQWDNLESIESEDDCIPHNRWGLSQIFRNGIETGVAGASCLEGSGGTLTQQHTRHDEQQITSHDHIGQVRHRHGGGKSQRQDE